MSFIDDDCIVSSFSLIYFLINDRELLKRRYDDAYSCIQSISQMTTVLIFTYCLNRSKRMIKTRNRLLQELDYAQRTSKRKPVSMFIIYLAEEDGATLMYDMERLWDKSEVMAKLMDLSLSHRVVNITSSNYGVVGNGICVRMTVMPDKECQTNIDAEFMEQIMGMKFNGE